MFIYLDTETTGSGPEDRLCQIAFEADTGTTMDELFNPNMPINGQTNKYLSDLLIFACQTKRNEEIP